MGGECNYLHRTVVEDGVVKLQVVPGEQWKNGRGVRWSTSAIRRLLNKAEETLRSASERLGLDVKIIRKERAVGLVRNTEQRFLYETLEEMALTVQEALLRDEPDIPFTCFNGGNDVVSVACRWLTSQSGGLIIIVLLFLFTALSLCLSPSVPHL